MSKEKEKLYEYYDKRDFDLDPSNNDSKLIVKAAKSLKEFLDSIALD